MLAQSGWRPEMLLSIHNVQGGPTRIIWLKMSTVPRLKKRKKKKKQTCFTPQFLKSIISWSETVRGTQRAHIQTQFREISLDISPSFPQALQRSIWVPCVSHSNYITPLPGRLQALSFCIWSAHVLHCRNDCIPSLPKAPVCLLMVLKSSLIGLNCLSIPPLLCKSKSP